MNQLTLFSCDASELESKALLVVELDAEIIDLEGQRKEAGADVRAALKDLNDQIRDAKSRRATASRELYALKRAGV